MIGTYVLLSAIDDVSKVDGAIKRNITEMNSVLAESDFNGYFNSGEKLNLTKLNDYSGIVIIILSGGTEAFAKLIIENCSIPVLILANSEKNSFAASLETYAKYKNHKSIKLFYYSSLAEVKIELTRFEKISSAIEKINKSKLGLFGKPSSWLLTSENIKTISNFKTSLNFYGVEKIISGVDDIPEPDAEETAARITGEYDPGNIPKKDLLDSAKVYLAIKKLASENDLSAVSIRCFDLLPKSYTACMGMSLCNDENLVAGCEGDIQAAFTMMVGSYLTGSPCWMANPARIDKANNILTLAHCTIPGKMLTDKKESRLVTHMESDLSVAIQGAMRKGEVTIFRIGGDFDKIQIVTGRIMRTNMLNPNFCRTQAEIVLDADIELWIKNSLGNHQVLVYGNIAGLLKEFAEFTGLDIV